MIDRQCLWIGIRPSGLGERLRSRQYDEKDGAADDGERCPFEEEAFLAEEEVGD